MAPPTPSPQSDTNARAPLNEVGISMVFQVLHWILLFFLFQNFVGFFVQKFISPPKTIPMDSTVVGTAPHRQGKPFCLWDQGTLMDLDVIITDSPLPPKGWTLTTPSADTNHQGTALADGQVNPRRTKFTFNPRDTDNHNILGRWNQQGLVLGGRTSTTSSSLFHIFSPTNQVGNHRNTTLILPMTPSVWNNVTGVYAYVRLMRRRMVRQRDGSVGRISEGREDVLIKRVVLTRHRKRKKPRDEKSLLDSQSGGAAVNTTVDSTDNTVLSKASSNKTHDQMLLYIKPSLTLQMVDLGHVVDFPTREAIPRQFSDHMDWYEGDDGETTNSALYYPILYVSEFWITYDSLREVTGALKESKIDIKYEPVPMWKWQLQAGMEDSWKKQEAFSGEEDSSNDMLRTMLIETNPYLLAVTAIVSLLHTVFDILAFKNDISFFKNKKSMEGFSLRSMVVNFFFSLVILLYLVDNDTSFMILASNGVGLLIDAWKISKAITIKVEGGRIEWVESSSYGKSRTKEYDMIATSHLLFVTMPLVTGYGMYSLLFQKHKGWYSWILNTLVGFIYMFGFVMMTPQLFINYKLQSVAHLNWRTMSYKSINTFIDDLFAFVIKMPIMHRLACLRDDVIFFIFCYQRFKYRTDYTRVNEFGQCSDPTDEMLLEQTTEQIDVPAAGNEVVEYTAGVEQEVETLDQHEAVQRRRGARDR